VLCAGYYQWPVTLSERSGADDASLTYLGHADDQTVLYDTDRDRVLKVPHSSAVLSFRAELHGGKGDKRAPQCRPHTSAAAPEAGAVSESISSVRKFVSALIDDNAARACRQFTPRARRVLRRQTRRSCEDVFGEAIATIGEAGKRALRSASYSSRFRGNSALVTIRTSGGGGIAKLNRARVVRHGAGVAMSSSAAAEELAEAPVEAAGSFRERQKSWNSPNWLSTLRSTRWGFIARTCRPRSMIV
jgi:hypothetical protein